MTICFIGLGSNLNQPIDQVTNAIVELAEVPQSQLLEQSPLYKSKPLAGMQQPDFVNAVAKMHSQLSAQELLQALFKIEQRHGRERKEHWGPRSLDLDLLLYGREIIDEPGLTVPHPGISQRCFVLVPLLDLGCGDVPLLGSITHYDGACKNQLERVQHESKKEWV